MRCFRSKPTVAWYRNMEWNMEENFSIEWNMKWKIFSRGGVLEDVLKDTFSSPWPRSSSPWPWPRSLRSLKIALSSARGQHYLFNR